MVGLRRSPRALPAVEHRWRSAFNVVATASGVPGVLRSLSNRSTTELTARGGKLAMWKSGSCSLSGSRTASNQEVKLRFGYQNGERREVFKGLGVWSVVSQ